jgi:hypothetical protein
MISLMLDFEDMPYAIQLGISGARTIRPSLPKTHWLPVIYYNLIDALSLDPSIS